MSLLSMCRSEVQLERSPPTKDTSGGSTKGGWNNIGDAVPCDIQPANSSTMTRYLQDTITVSHTILLTQDVGALAGDRFTTTDDADNARIFKVEGYRRGANNYAQWPGVADCNEEIQPSV